MASPSATRHCEGHLLLILQFLLESSYLPDVSFSLVYRRNQFVLIIYVRDLGCPATDAETTVSNIFLSYIIFSVYSIVLLETFFDI